MTEHSVLLATLLLSSDGLQVMPLAIVAVVVAYVASARLTPSPAPRRRRRPLLASHRRRSARLRTGRPSRVRERTAVLVRRRW